MKESTPAMVTAHEIITQTEGVHCLAGRLYTVAKQGNESREWIFKRE